MHIKQLVNKAIVSLCLVAPSLSSIKAEPHNKLTQDEIDSGWILLFDGATNKGWRGLHREYFPRRFWAVQENSLTNLALSKRKSFVLTILHRIKNLLGLKVDQEKRIHLITRSQYKDFDFRFEWKIKMKGNTGVKYFVTEKREENNGREYQIIDAKHRVELSLERKTASFYSVFAASSHEFIVGEFNQGRIVSCGNKVEHWLNGKRVLEYYSESKELKEALQESKFKDIPGFEKSTKGNLLLQDHGDRSWFRNLKLLDLSHFCQNKTMK